MQKRIRQSFYPLLIAALLSNYPASGQSKSEWRKKNDKKNRYEGQIQFDVSSAPIKLLSFYAYKESFNDGDTLRVKFYLHKNGNIYLTASELVNQWYYWMEAKPQNWALGWNEFAPWPVVDVLAPLQITADHLAIRLRIEKVSGSGDISPVILYHSQAPQKIENYTAYFQTIRSLSGGSLEVYRNDQTAELLQKVDIGRQSRGIPFPVKFSLENVEPGLLRLKLAVKPRNMIQKIPDTREYTFYHTSSTN